MSNQPRIQRSRSAKGRSDNGRKAEPKVTYLVHVMLPRNGQDERVSKWMAASQYIGLKLWDQASPVMTAFVWSFPDVVAYSVLNVTKKQRATLRENDVVVPHKQLTRLVRTARELAKERKDKETSAVIPGLAESELVMQIPEQGEWRIKIDKDEHGVAQLEMADGGEDIVWEMGRGGVMLSLYLKSTEPKANGKIVALAWAGYPYAKAGQRISALQVAARALNSVLNMGQFQILSGLTHVDVPTLTSTGRDLARTEELQFTVPMGIWSDESGTDWLAIGDLTIEADLKHATDVDRTKINYYISGDNITLASTEGLESEEDIEKEKVRIFNRYKDVIYATVEDKMLEELGPEVIQDLRTLISLQEEIGPDFMEVLQNAALSFGRVDVHPSGGAVSKPAQ